MGNLFFVLAIISAAWGVVSSMMIVSFLSNHGVRINYFLLRLLLPRYVGQYRRMTRDETGKTGVWYYSFVIAMNLALVLVVIGLLLRFT